MSVSGVFSQFKKDYGAQSGNGNGSQKTASSPVFSGPVSDGTDNEIDSGELLLDDEELDEPKKSVNTSKTDFVKKSPSAPSVKVGGKRTVGRPRTVNQADSRVYTLRLSRSLYNMLRKICYRDETTYRAIIEKALMEYLSRHETQKKTKGGNEDDFDG